MSNGIDTYNTSIAKFLRGGRDTDMLNGKNKIVNGMEDPSYLAFTFGIEPSLTGLFAQDSLGLNVSDANNDSSYGALAYLKNAISPNTDSIIGSRVLDEEKGVNTSIDPDDLYNINSDNDTYVMKPEYMTFKREYKDMKNFVEGFKTITVEHPYMFQSIDGLQDAYKKYYNMHKEPFLGGNDTKLKFKCLETMDLRMNALFDAYARAVYDHKYRRMNLPRNLLTFNCFILVHDLRNLKVNNTDLMGSITSGDPRKGSVTHDIINNMSAMIFRFKNCVIDIEDFGSSMASITNADKKVTEFEFTLTYDDADIQVYSLADFFEYGQDDYPYHPDEACLTDDVMLNLYENKNSSSIPSTEIIEGYEENKNNSNIPGIEIIEGYEKTLDINDVLHTLGSHAFNYATSGTLMGNVYDKSWAGLLATMMSSISNGGVSGIINNALGTAHSHISYLYGHNEVLPHGTLGKENIYDEPSKPNKRNNLDTETDSRIPDYYNNIKNVYGNMILTHQQMSPDTVYQQVPAHQQMNPGTIYQQVPAHQQLGSESIEMKENSHEELLVSGTVYENTDSTAGLTVENIYDTSTISSSHERLDKTNVYPYAHDKEIIGELGTAYSSVQINQRYIPINVYDRISEYGKGNDIQIEKIYIKPTKSNGLQTEQVFEPIKETKASTPEEMDADTKKTRQKIKNSIYNVGNVYF